MTGSRSRPAIASDDWMLEQQVRAEMEAEAWRRLRKDLAVPEIAAPAAPAPDAVAKPFDHHRSGSAILKALVRFMLASFMAYLAFIAALDGQLGEFEVWLAVGASFMVTLALSMFGIAREFVHSLAETARWLILGIVGVGAIWVFVQMSGLA